LFVGSEDCGVRHYDLVLNKLIKTYQTTGKLFFIIKYFLGYISGISFSEDCRTLAIGSLDNTLKLVDLESKKIANDYRFDQEVTALTFLRD